MIYRIYHAFATNFQSHELLEICKVVQSLVQFFISYRVFFSFETMRNHFMSGLMLHLPSCPSRILKCFSKMIFLSHSMRGYILVKTVIFLSDHNTALLLACISLDKYIEFVVSSFEPEILGCE